MQNTELSPAVVTNFIASTQALQDHILAWAERKGWFTPGVVRNPYELIALMHSELGEATEWQRQGNPPSDHIPEFTGVEEEFADVFIRMLNMCGEHKMRFAHAVIAKLGFNENRPYRHGNKSA